MLLNSDRAGDVLSEYGLDALIATTQPNFLYATSYGRTLPYVVGSPVAAVVIRDPAGLGRIVLPRIEAPNIVERPELEDRVVLYGSFTFSFAATQRPANRDAAIRQVLDHSPRAADFTEGIATALVDLGLGSGRIGWDDVAAMAAAQPKLDAARHVDARLAWRSLRRVKTEDEIGLLRTSAAITEEIETHLMSACRPGVDPADLRREYERRTVERGAVPGFWSSGGGPNAGIIVDSSAGPLRPGDLMRFDFGCRYGHYWSDTGRTVSLGEPDQLVRRRYQALRSGIEAGWAVVKPGAVPAEVYATVMSAVRQAGFEEYSRHHVGHSIGIEMYDGTMISPADHEPLEAGMVINLEVPYYEVGWGGLQIEDTAVIREDGPELLTQNATNLRIEG